MMNQGASHELSTQDVRAIFDEIISGVTDPDRRAKLALLREYCTDPRFREQLSDFLWNMSST
jgi:hypothetical protein